MISYTNLYQDCRILVESLMPWFTRKRAWREYMLLFADEMQVSHDVMYDVVTDVWDIISYGTQVGVLEEYLNDKYDATSRGITVTNSQGAQDLITLYNYDEYDPTPDTLYLTGEGTGWELYNTSEIPTLTFYDYIVDIPTAVWSGLSAIEQDQFIARLEIFKPAGKRYEITQS